jgi:hypothetical protein
MAEQTITKAVNETIRVSVDVAVRDIAESAFTGFRVVYPAELMVPVGTGSGNAVRLRVQTHQGRGRDDRPVR